MKTIMITGYSGLLGSNFVKSNKEKYNFIYFGNTTPPDVSSHSIYFDLSKTEDPTENMTADCLVHFAGQPSVWFARENISLDCQINLIGTIKILEYCKKNKIKKVIIFSTIDIFGPNSEPDENSEIQILNPYSLSKYCMERYADYFRNEFNLDVRVIRLSFAVGPGLRRNPLFDIVKGFITNKIELFVNEQSKFDFIHTSDINNAINKIIDEDTHFHTINLCSKKTLSLQNIITYLNNKLSIYPEITYKEKGNQKVLIKGMKSNVNWDYKPKENIREFSIKLYEELKNEHNQTNK